jgi:glycosidase
MELLAFYEDMSLEIKQGENNSWNFSLPHHFDSLPQKALVRIYSYKGNRRGNDLAVPVINDQIALDPSLLDRHDYRNNIMYFAMVDRFFDGDSTNNHPTLDPSIHEKANHHGGDIIGLAKKVQDGYLDSLGVNALWISPITQNPEGAYGLWDKGVESTFSAYHGYWPISSTKVDYRFGTSEDLNKLISSLHQSEMNIFLDYVANHVHEEHPIYQQHPDWATDLYLPDGSLNTEKWDEHRLTTWFDTFLPTLDLRKLEVVEPLTDSAMFWIENYELDGLRHDATKHIPELFWRTLTLKVKKFLAEHPDRSILQIGETYGNPELIASYIGSGMMDSQFDFNLYDAAVDAFAKDDTDFENLKRVLAESLHAYGSHHTMGNITGNQDRARFISYADGGVKFDEDPKLAGWIRDIEHMSDEGFPKIQLLTSFLMSVPGIPCVYYGDEIGMPGGNDPDNRRMMHFDDWNAQESATFEHARNWIRYRKSSMALLYGETYFLPSTGNSLVICRRYFDDVRLSVFSKSQAPEEIEITIDPSLKGINWESITGQRISSNEEKITIEMQPWSSALISSVK